MHSGRPAAPRSTSSCRSSPANAVLHAGVPATAPGTLVAVTAGTDTGFCAASDVSFTCVRAPTRSAAPTLGTSPWGPLARTTRSTAAAPCKRSATTQPARTCAPRSRALSDPSVPCQRHNPRSSSCAADSATSSTSEASPDTAAPTTLSRMRDTGPSAARASSERPTRPTATAPEAHTLSRSGVATVSSAHTATTSPRLMPSPRRLSQCMSALRGRHSTGASCNIMISNAFTLPRGDGASSAKQLRAQRPRIRIVSLLHTSRNSYET